MSQQSDAHSVSSGLSNHTTASSSGGGGGVIPPLQQTTSSSVASSSQPLQQKQQVPMVQNPFETLSSSSSNVPPSHVAVQMPQPMMMMMPPPQQSQPVPSPMKTTTTGGRIMGTSMPIATTPPPPPSSATAPIATTTMGVPIMGGSHSKNITIPSVVPPPPQQQQVYSTTAIPSPMAQPMNPSYNNNHDFPNYDHPSSAQNLPMTNMVGTTTMTTYPPNDFIFDDDENTVPSSLGNTTDDQLSQQQQYRRNYHPHYHSSNHNNTQEYDPPDAFPTMIGSSSLTSRIIESTKRFITSGSSQDLNPNDPTTPSSTHRSNTTTTTPILTATNRENQNQNNINNTPCLISGYLQKLGRNQKWQTRWFETNGIYLSYYKSSKRSNLLATLDLQKVGVIEIDTEDKTEHSFRIQVLGRLYQLRANSRASCQDWVITLNRVKEARMQQGNVKLVGLPTTSSSNTTTTTKRPLIANIPLDLLNPSTPSVSSQQQQQQQQQNVMNNDSENNFMDGTPRVVVVSNRERTHGVDEEDQWDQLIRIDDNTGGTYHDTDIDPAASQVETIYSGSSKRLSSIGTVVAARWTKHQSKMQRLGNKFSKWARSVKKYSCTDNDAVIVTSGGRPHGDVVHLDKYLHPPGHDDKLQKQQQRQQQQQVLSKMQSLSMPITTNSTTSSSINTAKTMPLPTNTATSTAIPSVSSSVLPITSTTTGSTAVPVVLNKPLAINDRMISSASDYDARMLS